ncbi:MAG: PilZ domain-containing protein [Candidatus Omnitrophota bacterium]
MDERRKYDRVLTALNVYYSKADNEAVERSCKSSDISLGGIGLVLNEEVEAGDLYNLRIIFPHLREEFKVSGRVIYKYTVQEVKNTKGQCRIGFVFVNLASEQRKFLHEAIDKIKEINDQNFTSQAEH